VRQATALAPAASSSLLPEVSDEARGLHASCLVFDLHCDALLNETLLGLDPTKRHKNRLPFSPFLVHCDIPRLQEGGVGAAALGIVVNPLRQESALRATFHGLDQVAGWQRRAPDDVALVSTADDIVAARAAGRIAVFGGLEGAHGLGGRLDPLPELRERGLRYVGLAHFTRNAACRPSGGWGASATSPLTDYGRELVDELNRLRILVDLAHIGRAGFLEASKRSRAPVIVSHTGVRGIKDLWRNVDDEQLRAVAATGGVVGIIFAPVFVEGRLLGSMKSVVESVCYVIDCIGEDHVGIGTDLDGFILPPKELPDVAALPRLTQALLDAGLGETQIRKCLGQNQLRVFRDACG
jgi:membrane dipeptidase